MCYLPLKVMFLGFFNVFFPPILKKKKIIKCKVIYFEVNIFNGEKSQLVILWLKTMLSYSSFSGVWVFFSSTEKISKIYYIKKPST